jgi:HEAT repeat protein
MGVLLLLTVPDEAAKNALATLCLRHIEDPARPLLRRACASRLGALGFPHAIPKLLRRIKYETDTDTLIQVFLALGKLGNPSGLANLLAWLQDPKWAHRAGTPMVTLVQVLGQSYDPKKDGWPGLTRKAKHILEVFKQRGNLEKKTKPSSERTLREYWLFLRHLDGTKLRPIDDARFICKRAGLQPIPLLRKACLDKRQGVRVRILQTLIDLGHPSHAALDHVRQLLADPLCAPYAIEAIGALGGKDAWDTLHSLVENQASPRTPKERELRIATLKALMHLEEAASIPLLQKVFSESKKDLEMRIYAAAALRTASRAEEKRAEEFLKNTLKEKSFHPPTLRELLDR